MKRESEGERARWREREGEKERERERDMGRVSAREEDRKRERTGMAEISGTSTSSGKVAFSETIFNLRNIFEYVSI